MKLLLTWGPNGVPGSRSTTPNELPVHIWQWLQNKGSVHWTRKLQKDYVEGFSLPCALPIHWYVAVKQRSGPWALGITWGGSQLTSSGSGHMYLHTDKISRSSVAHCGQGKEKEDDRG